MQCTSTFAPEKDKLDRKSAHVSATAAHAIGRLAPVQHVIFFFVRQKKKMTQRDFFRKFAHCSGHYISYLPASERQSVLTFFDRNKTIANQEDTNPWLSYKHPREYYERRLEIVYGVKDEDVVRRDRSVPRDKKLIFLVDGERYVYYTLVRPGVPISLEALRAFYGDGAWTLADEDVRMFRYVYKFKREAAPSRTGDAAYDYFMRVIEDGSFLKLPETNDGGGRVHQVAVDDRSAPIKKIPDMDEPTNIERARAFHKKVQELLGKLYEVLVDAKNICTEASVLLRILKQTWEYKDLRSMTVEQADKFYSKASFSGAYEHAAMTNRNRAHKDGAPGGTIKGKHSVSRRLDNANARFSTAKCCVGGCAMFENALSEAGAERSFSAADLVLHFKRDLIVVNEESGRAERASKDVKSSDLIYNFCAKHGNLVFCAWYLLNQRKIWAAEFYEILSLDARSSRKKFVFAADAINAVLLKRDVLNEYRKQCEIAMMCVQNYVSLVEAGIISVRNKQQTR